MKKTIISILFLGIMLTASACTSVDVEEVKNAANQSFNNKEFAEFMKQYNKLKKADKEEAATFLNKLKEHEWFNIDSYAKLADIDSGINLMTTISNEVPVLSEHAKSKSAQLTENKTYFEAMNKAITTVNTNHLKKLDSPTTEIYSLFIMMDKLDTANKVAQDLTSFVTDANSIVITVEDIKAPKNYSTLHTNFVDSLRKYKDTLEAKMNFIKSNTVDIVAYNQLFLKGNILAVDKYSKLKSENDKLTNDIKTAAANLKQRTDSLQAKF